MTYEQVLSEFMEYIYPYIPKYMGEDDDIYLREEWNNWLDSLAKTRNITQCEADTWESPW